MLKKTRNISIATLFFLFIYYVFILTFFNDHTSWPIFAILLYNFIWSGVFMANVFPKKVASNMDPTMVSKRDNWIFFKIYGLVLIVITLITTGWYCYEKKELTTKGINTIAVIEDKKMVSTWCTRCSNHMTLFITFKNLKNETLTVTHVCTSFRKGDTLKIKYSPNNYRHYEIEGHEL